MTRDEILQRATDAAQLRAYHVVEPEAVEAAYVTIMEDIVAHLRGEGACVFTTRSAADHLEKEFLS
jgi:hypothetical protein